MVRFGWLRLSGVFVDMAVRYLLRNPKTLGLYVRCSKIIAGEVAIFNKFLWNDIWTFADFSSHQQQWRQCLKRFLKFNNICLADLGVQFGYSQPLHCQADDHCCCYYLELLGECEVQVICDLGEIERNKQ